MNSDPSWNDIEVAISAASVPGEGGHKIMGYIHGQRVNPGHDPNMKYVIYRLVRISFHLSCWLILILAVRTRIRSCYPLLLMNLIFVFFVRMYSQRIQLRLPAASAAKDTAAERTGPINKPDDKNDDTQSPLSMKPFIFPDTSIL